MSTPSNVGHGASSGVQADTTAILADTGAGTDAAVQPGSAGSLHAHVRDAQADIDVIDAIVDKLLVRVPDTATYGPAGNQANVALGQSELGTVIGVVDGIVDKLLVRLPDTATYGPAGDQANAALGQSALGTRLGTPVGADFSADIAALKAETVLIKADTTAALALVPQPVNAAVTEANNVGATIKATATGRVQVKKVYLYSTGANAGGVSYIVKGAAGQVELIAAATATQAALSAAGKCVESTIGCILETGQTITVEGNAGGDAAPMTSRLCVEWAPIAGGTLA